MQQKWRWKLKPHSAEAIISTVPQASCLVSPGGGGVIWGPGQPRLTHPPTHPHQKNFPRRKMKFTKEAGNWRPILGTQFFWPLNPCGSGVHHTEQ